MKTLLRKLQMHPNRSHRIKHRTLATNVHTEKYAQHQSVAMDCCYFCCLCFCLWLCYYNVLLQLMLSKQERWIGCFYFYISLENGSFDEFPFINGQSRSFCIFGYNIYVSISLRKRCLYFQLDDSEENAKMRAFMLRFRFRWERLWCEN